MAKRKRKKVTFWATKRVPKRVKVTFYARTGSKRRKRSTRRKTRKRRG